MDITKYTKPILSYTRKNAPTILSTLGMVGVATTAMMAVKDSKKADVLICKRNEFKREKYGEDLTTSEKIIAATPAYIPTIMSGLATITCIYGANYINKNRQAMLLSAYGYLNNCFVEYKDAVNELYGEDASEKVDDHVREKKLEILCTDLLDEQILICEEYTDTYIKTTRSKIEAALCNANRHYNFSGALSINDFLDLLDQDEVPHGSLYGWSFHKDNECIGQTWIDATIEQVKAPGEYPLYKLCWNVQPYVDYIEWSLYPTARNLQTLL